MKRRVIKTCSKCSSRKLNRSNHENTAGQRKKRSQILRFLSSLIIPLVLGVFTIVTTFHQQKMAREQRLEDLTESRYQRQREEEHQRNLTDMQYKDQLLVAYIKDIAQLLKESNGSFTADKTTANIARIKTLNIFRQLDADRNVQIIRFLHEAGQLNSTNVERSLDLSTAELKHFNFRDAAVNKQKLEFLVFNNAFLYNVTLAELEMKENNFANTAFDLANFRFSRMKAMKFISAIINNTDFTRTTLDNTSFDNAQLNNTNFFNAILKTACFRSVSISNATFSRATLENVDFRDAQINNTAFNNATLRIANFHSAILQDINFQFAQFIDPVLLSNQTSILADFSSTTFRNVDFSFGFISKAVFESSTLDNVNFAFSELFDVNFSPYGPHFELNFSNALLCGITYSSNVTMWNTDFSHSRLININIYSAWSQSVDFSSATLTDANLSSSGFNDANFSSAILKRVNFHNARMVNTDFSQATCVTTRFDEADLSHSNFLNANLKHTSFNRTALTNASFDGANLYKVNFTNSTVTDDQLRTAFSIQEIVLPNGTVVKENNLIRNGEAACNVSITGDWTLENGMVNTSISNSSKDDCQFHLQSHTTGATMSQRVNLSDKWDSTSWPYSKAVLTAHMSMNVFLVLEGLDSTGRIVLQTTLSKSNDMIDIVLQNTMRELEVVVHFNPVIDQTENSATWCDNIRLFIIYGTYKELIRVSTDLSANGLWEQKGLTVAGGNGPGENNNQLHLPGGLFVDDDDDQTIVIADKLNHRIMQWKRGDIQGQVVAGGNGWGSRLDQLNYPTHVLIDKETNSLIIAEEGRVVRWSRRYGTTQGEILTEIVWCFGLAMDEQRNLYASDSDKHEVRRYEIDRGDETGTVVAGGNGEGSGLNQLNSPAYLFIDKHQSLYVSDSHNHRVMKWDKDAAQGIVVAGGQGDGSALTQLSFPHGIFVDTLGTLYVVEGGNHRVTRWPQRSEKKGTVVVGGNGGGSAANQFNLPAGLSLDKHGNLYVVDFWNHRVQRFNRVK